MRRLVPGLVSWLLVLAPSGSIFIDEGGVFVPGGTFSVGVDGFACSEVQIRLGGRLLGTVHSGPPGAILDIPADIPPGEQTLKASCGNDDATTKQVRVVPGATHGQRIALSPAAAEPGTSVTVGGTGFDDCITGYGTHDGGQRPVDVSVALDGTPVATVPVAETPGTKGTFRTSFPLRPDLPAGDHQVTASCPNRFLPGSSTAAATLTVTAAGPSPTPVPPRGGGNPGGPGGSAQGGGDPADTAPQVPAYPGPGTYGGGGSSPSSSSIPAVIGGAAVVIAAIGAVALRRRLRPAGAMPAPVPPRPSGRLPIVVARPAGMSSPPARLRTGPGRDVAVRVVARHGGVR
jgi:hypothetical protein